MAHLTEIGPDSYLTLHYRIALAPMGEPERAVVDTFPERPATLQMGAGQLAEPLEQRLYGLKAGDHKTFLLAPDEAYGPRNPELLQRVSRKLLEEHSGGADYEPGDLVEFNAPSADGGETGRFAGVLKELNDQFALFDFNHPLAGHPLRFEVKIIGVL